MLFPISEFFEKLQMSEFLMFLQGVVVTVFKKLGYDEHHSFMI